LAHRSPAGLTPAEGRKFALTLAVAFGVLAGITWWRESPRATAVFGAIAVALALGGLLVPGQLGPVYRGWMGFARALSRVTTPIFMGVVYFLVITPIAAIRRAVGGNPLRAHAGESGWVGREESPRSDLTRQF